MTPLAAGTVAPAFSLLASSRDAGEEQLSLTEKDFRGRPLILAFYPADWSPVCGDQLALYNAVLPQFERLGAALLGVSVDGVFCHQAYARDRNLRFPLVADFEPKGRMARNYGVYRTVDGTAERALFVLDGDGVIRWSHVSPVDVNPGADGILREWPATCEAPTSTSSLSVIWSIGACWAMIGCAAAQPRRIAAQYKDTGKRDRADMDLSLPRSAMI